MSLPNLSKLAKTAAVYINDTEAGELYGDQGYYYRMKGVADDMIDTRLKSSFEKAKDRIMDDLIHILSEFQLEHQDLNDLIKYQSSFWIPTVRDCKVFISANWRVFENKLWVDLTSVHVVVQVHEGSLLAQEFEPIQDLHPGPFHDFIAIATEANILPDPQKTFEDTLKDMMLSLRRERGPAKGRTHLQFETFFKQNQRYNDAFLGLADKTIDEIDHALSDAREKMNALDARNREMHNRVNDEIMQVERELVSAQACRSGLLDGTNKSQSTGVMNMIVHHHGSHMQLSHTMKTHKDADSTAEFPHIGDKVDVFISNRDGTVNVPMQNRADVTRALNSVLEHLHGASSNKVCIAVYGVDMKPEQKLFPGETVFRPAGKCLLYLVRDAKVVDMLTAVVAVTPPHKIFSVQSIFHTNFGISKAIHYWQAVEEFTYAWFEF